MRMSLLVWHRMFVRLSRVCPCTGVTDNTGIKGIAGVPANHHAYRLNSAVETNGYIKFGVQSVRLILYLQFSQTLQKLAPLERY
jgi:hypothetical protein